MKTSDALSSFVTFEDIFALALASATADHFTADPDKWHKVIHEVCQEYGQLIPELRRIYFTLRPPLPPQSEQVDQLIKVLNRAREISLPNPDYQEIHMHSSKKQVIKERESQRLAMYGKYIQDISKLLDKELAVPGPMEET